MGENQHKRKYTEEFKGEAVRLSNESGKSIEAMALELGLSRWTLKNWRYELRRKGKSASLYEYGFDEHGASQSANTGA